MNKNYLLRSDLRTKRKYSLWIGCGIVILGIWLITNSAFSIPNCCGVGNIKPAGSWIPHEHSVVTSAGFLNGTVTMADTNRNGIVNEPGERATVASGGTAPDTNTHQHRDADRFTNLGGEAGSRWDFSDLAWVWDNRSIRLDAILGVEDPRAVDDPNTPEEEESGPCNDGIDNGGDGNSDTADPDCVGAFFDSGHGFIDEHGYGFSNGARDSDGNRIDVRPRYKIAQSFVDELGSNAIDAVSEAFVRWSEVDVRGRNLVTGLDFIQVTSGPTEIEIRARDLGIDGALGVTCDRSILPNPDCGGVPDDPTTQVVIAFNTNADFPAGDDGFPPPDVTETWSFIIEPVSDVRPDQVYFFGTALHEIGHAIGIDHWTDESEVMHVDRGPGCPEDSSIENDDEKGPCHSTITPGTRHGIIDLYSIPTPDFGDAPATYPTLLKDNGARAPTLAYEWLGPRPADGTSTTSRERDAKIVDKDEEFHSTRKSPNSAGEFTVEPEQGCDIKGTVPGGQATVSYTVSVNNPVTLRYQTPPARLYVAIWVDWNRDKNWTSPTLDPGELLDLSPGPRFVNTISPRFWTPLEQSRGFKAYGVSVRVPEGAKPGETWMRCRLVYGLEPGAKKNPGAHVYLEGNSGDEGLLPLIDSPDNGGEIEDHKVCIGQPKADKKQNSPAVPPGGSITFTITLENTTLCDYESVELFDALSGHVAFGRIVQAPPGIFYNPDRLALDGEFPLASGESATIVYTVTVGDFVPAETIIPNCVTLDGLSFRLERCTETIVTP